MKEILEDRNKRGGIIGTSIFLVLLFLFFAFAGLAYPDPPKEPILLELLLPDESSSTAGGGQPAESSETEEAVEAPAVEQPETTPTPADEIIETDETAEVAHESGTPTEPEQEADPDKLFPFGGGSGNNNNSGDNGSNGNNGSGDGEASGPGHGDIGDNGDWSLDGRGLVDAPSMQEQTVDQGTVVLNIWVDRGGNVTRTTPNLRLSSTTSTELFDLAETAARKAKFNSNSTASVEQKGTMTFNFIHN
jgi:outer membrane biosynthesis protein TonB